MKEYLTAIFVVFIVILLSGAIAMIAVFINKGRQTVEPTKEKIASTCFRKEMNNFLSAQSDTIVIDNQPFVCTKTNDGVFCQEIPECP